MVDSSWISIEEALVLRGAALIAALRDGSLRTEGCRSSQLENPEHWSVLPTAVWHDTIFIGEPGFPTLEGRPVWGIVYVMRRATWQGVKVRRADVEALPRSAELARIYAYEWLLERGKEEQRHGRRLKQQVEWASCKAVTGVTWREYLAAFQSLPEQYRFTRGRH